MGKSVMSVWACVCICIACRVHVCVCVHLDSMLCARVCGCVGVWVCICASVFVHVGGPDISARWSRYQY